MKYMELALHHENNPKMLSRKLELGRETMRRSNLEHLEHLH